MFFNIIEIILCYGFQNLMIDITLITTLLITNIVMIILIIQFIKDRKLVK